MLVQANAILEDLHVYIRCVNCLTKMGCLLRLKPVFNGMATPIDYFVVGLTQFHYRVSVTADTLQGETHHG